MDNRRFVAVTDDEITSHETTFTIPWPEPWDSSRHRQFLLHAPLGTMYKACENLTVFVCRPE